MTDPNRPQVCRCMKATDALRLALAEQPIPECPDHQAPASAPPIALNNDKALANLLGATLRNGDL